MSSDQTREGGAGITVRARLKNRATDNPPRSRRPGLRKPYEIEAEEENDDEDEPPK